MLKKIRVVVAILVFAFLTFGFIDFAGFVENPMIQKIQFGPALMSLSLITLVVLAAITFVFGRIYCSVICPLGIFQDFFNWLSKKFNKKKKYGFKAEMPWLRWGVLAVLVVAWLFHLTVLVGLFEPYSAFGRIATELFKPVYVAGNNILAGISERNGSYTFYYTILSKPTVMAVITAALTFIVVGYMSFMYGRTWCNTICPVGTILGFFSRRQLMGVRIDDSKCNHCQACQRKCKSYCIDSKNQKIDHSRCVDCFDCLDVCRQDAISYGPINLLAKSKPAQSTEHIDTSKREFLTSALVVAYYMVHRFFRDRNAAAAPSAVKAATGVQDAVKKITPMSPPGSGSHKNLLQHCTSCHLCISKCPSHVLKPAGLEYGLGGIMQPVMKFDQGYCNYDCKLCSEICPDGAIKPLTVEEKHHTQPGMVVFTMHECVVYKNETSCGACAEHCPTLALKMVPYKDGLTIPQTNTDLCVGCGGCEFICPVKAVRIHGHAEHKVAVEPVNDQVINTDNLDFGF